jgi:hypothetical protein
VVNTISRVVTPISSAFGSVILEVWSGAAAQSDERRRGLS